MLWQSGLPVPCHVAFPDDVGVFEVHHENRSVITTRLPALSRLHLIPLPDQAIFTDTHHNITLTSLILT